MLVQLNVRSLAVIDALEVSFGPGLQVITGETGAGKSILVTALKLVLGARAKTDMVRAGADAAEIEALFDLSDAPATRARLAEMLGEEDDELVVRRVIRAEGKSRAWINGRLATGGQLARITAPLVDISSQHAHHALADVASHLDFLDAYADLTEDRTGMREAWQAFRRATDAVEALAQSVRDRSEREAMLRFQRDEIASVDPAAGEDAALDAEHGLLAHAAQLADATNHAERLLYAGDAAASAVFAEAAAILADVAGVDEALDALAERLDAIRSDVDDLGRDFGRYSRRVVVDPARLAAVDERIATLRRLTRKYGPTLDDAITRLATIEGELADLDHADERLDTLETERRAAADVAVGVAKRLSEARAQAAGDLGQAITRELTELGMGDAEVQVDVAPLTGDGRALHADVGRLNQDGMDRVEFLIAPNRGEPPRPLHRIASGGELSRALLAIKRVLASRGPHGVHVFDEVDTGVGGAVAEAIGRKLFALSRDRQVLCITHLPQIAAYADTQFLVRKAVAHERTRSAIDPLDDDARTEEIARMMGGIDITDETRAAARTLMRQAASVRA